MGSPDRPVQEPAASSSQGRPSGDVPDWLKDLVGGDAASNQAAPQDTVVLEIPSFQMGALIGKGGETINMIRQNAQANIQIDELKPLPIARISITGNTDRAQKLIFDTLQEKMPQLFPHPGMPT